MQEEKSYKIKNLRKTGVKKDLVDSNGEIVQPGSRILKGYWGDWIVFGSRIPGFTLKLKIRIIPSGTKIRLINPLMTPDNNWENKRTSVHIVWGDGTYDKIYKKKINSGRFNRDSEVTIEHTYTAEVGDEMWLSITSIEPLVPYGCEIVEMLGQFPYDRYDLNMDRDGHYCGLFGVDQYIETYPELNKLYGAGKTITKVSSELLDNWRDIGNMDRMFEGWGLIEVPENFFKHQSKYHPDSPSNTPEWQLGNTIQDTCKSYYRTFANCPNLVKCAPMLLTTWLDIPTTTEEMFADCPKLTNTLAFSRNSLLVTTERMYANNVSLVKIDEKFMSHNGGGDDPGFSSLVNVNNMFDGCTKLTTVNWDRFMCDIPTIKTARYMFRGTAITHAGFIMGDKHSLLDITGIYMNCKKLRTVRRDTFTSFTNSFNDNSSESKDKLIIAHMFDSSGDPEHGIEIPVNFFKGLSRDTFSALARDCTYVFHKAVIRNLPNETDPGDSWNSEWMFVRVFEGGRHTRYKHDISHLLDGVTIKHKWVPAPDFYANNNIEKADYALANTKWDHIDNDIFFINDRGSWESLKSIKGLFYGSTINCKFPERFLNQPHCDRISIIEDYSEMFMNVKYKWSDLPIDYIVVTNANICDMSRMFKGSNITTYRPIHWRSNEHTTYDLTDFSSNSFSAPKEWILDGYTDRSKWEPVVKPKPFVLWVNTAVPNTVVSLAGDATVSIDWGDGSTDKGLSGGNMAHTYANPGDYKISVVSTKAHKPNAETIKRVFRIDGEIPYNTELDLTQDFRNNSSDMFVINYVGPRVAAVCKHLTLSCQGYISPSLLKYGSNSGYKEGLKFLDIIDPMDAVIEFSAPFVIVDKTITMNVDFVKIPFQIGKQTHVELTIGQVRSDNETLHVDFTNCTPRGIPVRFWNNCIGHKFNIFKNVKMLDVGYVRADHYEYGYRSVLHPDATNDKFYPIALAQPPFVDSLMTASPVYRFDHVIDKDYINEIYVGSVIARAITMSKYNELSRRAPLNPGVVDDHYSDYDSEWMTFVLENVNNKSYKLHDLNRDSNIWYDRDLGEVLIEVIDEDGVHDQVIKRSGKTDELGEIGPFTSKRLIIRIKSPYPIWLGKYGSDREEIVGVYGIIHDKEKTTYELKHRFGVDRSYGSNDYCPQLAPNLKWIGESFLWGTKNMEFDELFKNTKLEVIPPALFAYSEAVSFKECFARTKVKKIPDYLWSNDTFYGFNQNNRLDLSQAFEDCTNVEYVFEPIDPEIRMAVKLHNTFKGCKTYAYKNSSNIDNDVLKHTSIYNQAYYVPSLNKMTPSPNVPELTHDKLIALNRNSSTETVLVAVNSTIAVDPNKLVDKWHNLDYAMWIDVPKTNFGTNTASKFNYTQDQYNNIFKYLFNLRGFRIDENNVNGLVQKDKNVHPDHLMLINNENLLFLSNVLSGVQFNYTPNIFFINQWKMIDATGLLCNARFDKIPEDYIAPPSHLPDRVGRPIYIGDATEATRYNPRPIDKMLRYRNNYIVIKLFMNGIKEGDLTCPPFTKHRIINAMQAFGYTNTIVDDNTLIDIDRESNVYKMFTTNININNIFRYNTYIKTDCRVFHIWREVPNSGSGAEYYGTTEFLHPPKDMFVELTSLTRVKETFRKSNIRDLPDCNPIFREYPYFAAESKVSTIPEHWFKYKGTDTLDIRYAFNNCTGLIITHKPIDPTITVPVIKYASLENAWSIIGDDPEIFEGVNTKFDGSDKSLVRVIPEEDLFRQTLDIHDNRWTLSVKALGFETIGNEPVQGDDLFMVIWGDGSSPSVVSYREIEWPDYSHKYEEKGRYQVLILSTQWCCYINSPVDLKTKFTTYSIDGMFQNTTVAAIRDFGLLQMFGYTVEELFPTLFDKCSDVATVKSYPELFAYWQRLKSFPKSLLSKMTGLEDLTKFIYKSSVTSIDPETFKGNPNLKILDQAFSEVPAMNDKFIPENLFANNPNIESMKGTFAWNGLTQLPRNLLRGITGLKHIDNLVLDYNHFIMDDSYADFLATNVNLETAGQAFGNCIIKAMPRNLINRNTKLQNCWAMFALWDYDNEGESNLASKIPNDDEWNNFYIPMNKLDNDFRLEADFFPPSIVTTRWMFGHRNHLKGYAKGIFDKCTKLNNASVMFLNTGITAVQSDTFKNQVVTKLDLEFWLYKDKRLGKKYYSHYIPRFINPAINAGTVRTYHSLLGAFGTMTEAELFEGINTDPKDIQSLYVQEFEPATFKIKTTGDAVFITMKSITSSDVVYNDLTMIQWGDGTEDLYEEPIPKAELQNVIKHTYRTPGEYIIKVGAKYCLVPAVDTMPEAWQVEKVSFPEDIDQVKQVSIGAEYGVGSLDINKDSMYVEKQTAEFELSLVPRPYYVGETYTVDVTVEPQGLKVGEQTILEVDIVRDTSDPFERLEIGGTLGPMEGYSTFPKVSQMPEFQYKKWIGTHTFFSRNTQLTSFDKSFMNLPYEFRISDKLFWSLKDLTNISHCFWNSNMVIEPGWAPDFNKNTKLQHANSTFRGGVIEDVGEHGGIIYIPDGTPLSKITWKVTKDNYQPFSALNSLTDVGFICYRSNIPYALLTNFSHTSNLISMYEKAVNLAWLPADYLRTLNSAINIRAHGIFCDTKSLTNIQPASDGKTIFDIPIGANQTLDFSWAFAGSNLNPNTVIDAINNSSFIKTTVAGTTIDINNLFSWYVDLISYDGSNLKLTIPERSGSIDMTDLFSYDSSPETTQHDKDITMLYNIKAGAINIAKFGSPNIIVDNMFDHSYAESTVTDAHECFVVTGDDSNFTKAKELADKSALNTLTVMTTTVVPK